MPELLILTGPVRSGKTSVLSKWAYTRDDVFGILTPVIGGQRYFFNLASRISFNMEADEQEERAIEVGRYRFSSASFSRAEAELAVALSEASKKRGWLILDEIGPLELKGQGFAGVIRQILRLDPYPNLIFVVRENLLEEVMKHFQLKNEDWKVTDAASFENRDFPSVSSI